MSICEVKCPYGLRNKKEPEFKCEQLHLRLNLAYDTWFDGVDMAALARGEDNAVVQVLQAITNTASVALSRPDQN